MVRACPGRRVPGAVDGFELAVRAVLGQQISVAGARTLAGRLVAAVGPPLAEREGGLTHAFPDADAVAGVPDEALAMPQRRCATLRSLAAAVAGGQLDLDPGADRAATEAALLAQAGIGPWTASYVAMRALGDPDAFLPADLGVRHALEGLGVSGDPASAAAASQEWRPWRSYAVMHLWSTLGG